MPAPTDARARRSTDNAHIAPSNPLDHAESYHTHTHTQADNPHTMCRLRLLSNGHARKDTLPALAYGTHVLSSFGRSFTPRCSLYSRPPRGNYSSSDQLTAQATSTSTATSTSNWTLDTLGSLLGICAGLLESPLQLREKCCNY